jgi:hypothetical protein
MGQHLEETMRNAEGYECGASVGGPGGDVNRNMRRYVILQ